ncbi:hypothetical protein [Pseudomonas qingdaonensis]|uniref:hypothetical protein n=1 Tax=Pseudomonas qingdaonensis TaxID=2056231 RepID=UPI002432FD65|nr:hypothetical protein [Pseudomonas qingdaonensis]
MRTAAERLHRIFRVLENAHGHGTVRGLQCFLFVVAGSCMDKLTTFRMGLTLAAVLGLMPLTLLFIAGCIGFFFPMLVISEQPLFAIPIAMGLMSISLFGLWSCWKIYLLAMAEIPVVPNRRLLICGVAVTLIWGGVLAGFTHKFPQLVYIFMMPGLLSAALLWHTLRRERQAE